MRTRTISIVLQFLIVALLACGVNHQKRIFKYFQLEWSSAINNIVYSNKKALNNVIIEMEDGSVNILCVPFTRDEYEKFLSNRAKTDQVAVPHESVVLEISGRELKAVKKIIDQNECSMAWEDYYEGIAFLASYFGNCSISKGLQPILASIRYQFSKETVDKARNDFLDIMSSIEKMDVPVYRKGSDIQCEYSFVGLTKRIAYSVEIEPYSIEILNFYREFFGARGWKPYKAHDPGKWQGNRLFFTWIDGTGEILAKLVVLAGPKTEREKLVSQAVLIDVTPYLVTEWGKQKEE